MAKGSGNPSNNMTRKLVLAAIFAALGVFLSSFAIPVRSPGDNV